MIQQTLKKLRLNDKEIEVYLEMLRLGRATPATIARATGIKRATVYSVAKELIKKGIVAGDIGGKSLSLTASPDDLTILAEKQKREARETETLTRQAIEELSELPMSTQFAIPKIRFIDEIDLKEFLYKRADEWNKSAQKTGKVWWGFQDHTFVDNFKQWILDWYALPSAKEINVHLLTNRSEIEKEMQKLTPQQREQRDVRFLGKQTQFTASTWVVGEYLIMIYTREKPFYLIEINNPVLAHNMRELFKNIWRELK